MHNCETIREEFSALLDNELDAETRSLVEEHLANCADCLRVLDGYKKVSDLYAAQRRIAAPPGFEQAVARAVRPRVLPLLLRRASRPLAAAAAAALIVGALMWVRQVPDTPQIARNQDAQPMAAAPAEMRIMSSEAAPPPPAAQTSPQPVAASPAAPETMNLQALGYLAATEATKAAEAAGSAPTAARDSGPTPAPAMTKTMQTPPPPATRAPSAPPSPPPATMSESAPQIAATARAAKTKDEAEAVPPAADAASHSAMAPLPPEGNEVAFVAPADAATGNHDFDMPPVAAPAIVEAPKESRRERRKREAEEHRQRDQAMIAASPVADAASPAPESAGARKSADAAAAPAGTPQGWRVAGRLFVLQQWVWVEDGYHATADTQPTRVVIGSPGFDALVERDATLADLRTATFPVILKLGDGWVRLEPATP